MQPVKNVAKSKHDGFEIAISAASNRNRKKWPVKIMTWGDFKDKIAHPNIKPHTLKEYQAMDRDQKAEAKDAGGFVGGSLKEGIRKKGRVAWRTLITFDLDEPRADFLDNLSMLFDYEVLLYSTHSHTRDKPRYRVIFPLKEPVNEEQYEPISRMLAYMIDMESVAKESFDPIQMMFWPSMPSDVDYVFKSIPGVLLDPQEILAEYQRQGLDWQDTFHWPKSQKEKTEIKRAVDKAQNPLEKKGWIGAFCTTYSIEEAINTFLPDVYEFYRDGRYTYTSGSTAGGLVLYDDVFAYSNHSTDPISNRLVNAFDLVRVHKYGDLDETAKENTPVSRMPSYLEMIDLLRDDPAVCEAMSLQQLEQAAEDFSDDDLSWVGLIKKDKNGKTLQTIDNALTILDNDEAVKDKLGLNAFLGMPSLKKSLPWRDLSDNEFSNLWSDTDMSYLQKRVEAFGYTSLPKLQTALGIIFDRNQYHPVREYLQRIEWDGIPRAETILIDYLGAEDDGTGYVQEVTLKSLLACVYRVMRPGYKVDTMLVLVGKQGAGKSTLLSRLGMRWFSDSLDSIKGKDAYGQLRGSWIIEVGEMTATRKADNEEIKRFLTKAHDVYRAAYDRYESSIPRQCVFFGSTNDYDFLNDPTGNRRFWPVLIGKEKPTKDLWKDFDRHEVDQVWAEMYALYLEEKPIILNKRMEDVARQVQHQHTAENPLAGQIRDFLLKEFPKGYADMTAEEADYVDLGSCEKEALEKICPAMIWEECLHRRKEDLKPFESRIINQIIDTIPGYERKSGLVFARYGRQKGHRRKIETER